jgi:cytochrome P450
MAARATKAPYQIAGYDLPAQTVIANAICLLHTRPDRHAEPYKFKPERFLNQKRIDPWLWSPFGGGVRRCVGMAFALIEMRIVLATVLSTMELKLERAPVAERRGFFLVPKAGLPVEVIRRYRQ